MEKKVSAVITTHNRLNDLKNAINSVLEQTYKNIELIVVDDNSDDETKEYMENFAKENYNIKYIRISKDESKGGNYARNKGIDLSSGEYIAFLDDDDIWLPTKIEKQVKVIEKNKDIGLVYCGKYDKFDNGKKYKFKIDETYRGNLAQLCFQSIFCITSEILTRKSVLEGVGKFDINMKFWQEYDLTIRICQKYLIDYVNEPLIIYSVSFNDKARLTNKLEKWEENLLIFEKKYKEIIDNLPVQIQENRKLMILRDRSTRQYTSGRKKECKKTLKEIWKITKNIKDFAHYILNYPFSIKNKIGL